MKLEDQIQDEIERMDQLVHNWQSTAAEAFEQINRLERALERYYYVTGLWIFEGHGPNIHELRKEIEDILSG